MAGKVKKFFKWTGIALGTVIILSGAFVYHEWNADNRSMQITFTTGHF